VVGCVWVLPAAALEGGQSPYLKGFRDFQGTILPLDPGLYLRIETYLYGGSGTFQAPPPTRLRVNAKIDDVSQLIGPTVVTPWRLLGGTYALSARVTGSDLFVQRTQVTPRGATTAEGRVEGANDIQLTPFVLGWNAGNFHWNVSTSFWLPTGPYQSRRIANTGRNYQSLGPGVGLAYLDPQSGWEASAAATVIFSSGNPATHYHSGDVLHIDYSLAMHPVSDLKVGLVGYVMQQLTADSGTGAIFGSNISHVAAIGPAVGYNFSVGDVPMTLQAKYYREFFAQNTTRGNAGSLTLRVKF
jgi:hypothetical protein